ncbi:Transposase domain [Nitrosovibrio sp. Nv17]|nr:Transposase domain [Nitrosovibrio sp. Nv17]
MDGADALIEPYYYRGARGRPPLGLELMLRMYLCQNCLGLSDEGIEDAIVDRIAVRRSMDERSIMMRPFHVDAVQGARLSKAHIEFAFS